MILLLIMNHRNTFVIKRNIEYSCSCLILNFIVEVLFRCIIFNRLRFFWLLIDVFLMIDNQISVVLEVMVGLFDLVLGPFVIIVVYKCFSTTSKGILNLCHGTKNLILWDYNSAIVTIVRKLAHYSWDNSDTWNIMQKHIVLINFLAEKQRVLSMCSHQIILSWWIHQPRNS